MSETLIYIMIIAFNCLAGSSRNMRQSYTTQDSSKNKTGIFTDLIDIYSERFFLKAQSITSKRDGNIF